MRSTLLLTLVLGLTLGIPELTLATSAVSETSPISQAKTQKSQTLRQQDLQKKMAAKRQQVETKKNKKTVTDLKAFNRQARQAVHEQAPVEFVDGTVTNQGGENAPGDEGRRPQSVQPNPETRSPRGCNAPGSRSPGSCEEMVDDGSPIDVGDDSTSANNYLEDLPMPAEVDESIPENEANVVNRIEPIDEQ